MDERMIVKKQNNIVGRKIHGTYFLINIVDNYKDDKCALYEINETGMYIWNSINGLSNTNKLALMLKEEIVDDIDFQVILKDVEEFIGVLATNGFVEVCNIG